MGGVLRETLSHTLCTHSHTRTDVKVPAEAEDLLFCGEYAFPTLGVLKV